MNASEAPARGADATVETLRVLDTDAQRRTNGGPPSMAGQRVPCGAVKQVIECPLLGYKKSRKPCVPKAAWRQVALSRARRARHDLIASWETGSSGPVPDRWGEEAAEQILRAKDAAIHRAWPWAWFEGTRQEEAWLCLHEAEAEIIEILPQEVLLTRAGHVLNKARCVLGADHPGAQKVDRMMHEWPLPVDRLRPRVASLARETYDALDDRYARSRGYRNRLIRLTSVAVVGLALGFVAALMGSLDFHLGTRRPGWAIFSYIGLFGVVGALVSAVPAIAQAKGMRNPFSLPMFQLILKLSMGPLFALVGVLILQTQQLAGFQRATDLTTLVVWATVFGAAQQTVTRFIDQRVTGMLNEGPKAAPK